MSYTRAVATKTRLTLDEFLALPETEPPSEFLDGEVRQKVSPNLYHGILAVELASRLRECGRKSGTSVVGTEVRHITPDRRGSYLPDVHVTRAERIAGRGEETPVTVTPDLVVEILSPGDRPSDVLRKVDLYQELKVPVFLLVDPTERSVREYRPGEHVRAWAEGDTVDLSPVLRGCTISLEDLFGALPS